MGAFVYASAHRSSYTNTRLSRFASTASSIAADSRMCLSLPHISTQRSSAVLTLSSPEVIKMFPMPSDFATSTAMPSPMMYVYPFAFKSRMRAFASSSDSISWIGHSCLISL